MESQLARKRRTRIPQGARQAIYDRDGGLCHLCREPVDPAEFHLDHITPYSRGGSNDLGNLALAHPGCNIKKHNRTPEEFENGTPSRKVRGVMLDGSNDGGLTVLVRLPPHLAKCLDRMADNVGVSCEDVIRIAVVDLAQKWGVWRPSTAPQQGADTGAGTEGSEG